MWVFEVDAGIPFKVELNMAGAKFSIPGKITRELELYEIPPIVGALELISLDIPYREGTKDIVVLSPKNRKGYTRLRIRRKDEEGWYYVDLPNRIALSLASFLKKIFKAKNTIAVAFEKASLLVSKGERDYKLQAIFEDRSVNLKLEEKEKALLVGALKNMVFGRYIEEKVIISLVRGGFIQLQEKIKILDEEKDKEWQQKIPLLWKAAIEKKQYPSFAIRELLRRQNLEFKTFIRVKVSPVSGKQVEKIMVPLPLIYAYGFASCLEGI